MQVTVLEGQSLFDIAIQYTGSVESVWEIAQLNKCSITSNNAGMTILVPDFHQSKNERIKEIIASEQIAPATYASVGLNLATVVSHTYINNTISTQ